MSCQATGNPLPVVKWFKDGRVVWRGSTLTISTISRTEAGKYLCLAANGMGKPDMKFVSLTVNCKYP